MAIRLSWSFLAPSDAASMDRLPDQIGYVDLGRNLLERQGLVRIDARFDDVIRAGRMPLYPFFVAGCGASVTVIRMVQALIDTSTVLAVYLLARRWLTTRPSFLAAAFVAFNPFLIFFSALILSETLFTAMLAWAMVMLSQRNGVIWGGLVLAGSVLVRPSAIGLPVVMGIAGAFLNRSARRDRESFWALPVGSTMLFLTVVMLLPWAIRNRVVLGRWVWTSTDSGFVAYDGFNDQATGASDQQSLSGLEWNRRLRRLSEVDRNELLEQHARQWIAQTIREKPARLLQLTAVKITRTWSPIPLSQDFCSRRNMVIALLFAIPFDVLVVLGLWKVGMPRVFKVFLILPALYFTVMHAMSVGSLRYRVPVEPLLAVLAGAGAFAVLGTVGLPAWRRIAGSPGTEVVEG
ncbi:MAG: glycosyltransferase family 39 protein [Planctomycetota bacterium]|nr:glycosyltransferase family 39 protein [Planctomycetota bacterium]